MKSFVSYAKAMRQQAIEDRKGLFTIDLINASKRKGKLGSRITMQGPVNGKEFKALSDFILKFTKMRMAQIPRDRKRTKCPN